MVLVRDELTRKQRSFVKENLDSLVKTRFEEVPAI